MPSVSGTSVPNARSPAPPIRRTVSISSVAYATDESASLANTASAVGLSRRSWISWSVRILRPSIMVVMSGRRERGRPPGAALYAGGSPRWLAGGAGAPSTDGEATGGAAIGCRGRI